MIIEVDNISKSFGSTVALHKVSCGFPEGATGLLGPNGSGKTTLLRILLGLLPAQGRVGVLDLDPMRQPLEVRARIGYMPESECRGVGGTEDIDHIDRFGNVGERAIDAPAEDFLAGLAGIDRNDAVALGEQIFQHEIAWPRVPRRGADHGDGLDVVQDGADFVVAMGAAVSVGRQSLSQSGWRLSKKAPIPSRASAISMLSAMVWVANR